MPPSYFFLDRFEEAERALQRAAERKLEDPILLMIRYNIAVLKGDQDQMDRTVALAKGKPGAEHPVANAEALALARSGRLQLARQSSSRAMDLARQEGEREVAASYQAARAVWEAVCGNAAEAKKNAMAALALSNGRDVEYAAALPWLFRETPLDRNRLPMIWKSASRKIRSPNLPTYRFFARYRHWSTGSLQTAWSGCKSLCPMSWR